MGFFDWLKQLFHHINPHNLAGALSAGKVTIDSLGQIEHWAWIPQFDAAASDAIKGLNTWQPGQPTTQIVQSLNLAVSVLNDVQGLSQKDKVAIDTFVGAAEAALQFLG